MQIEVKVQGQKIKRLNSPGSVEDTLNYLTCHFVFEGEEWDDTVRTAYFENPASRKRYPKILADDGTCTVPWEALTDKGPIRFSVAGERENYRITTGIESFWNSGTIYGGNPSEPPTPDQYDQLIALAQETKEIAESVREDADAGEFDGEPGKPGDPGKDGVSPSAKVEQTDDGAVITVTDATGTTNAELKNGKDGNPGQDATDEQVQAAVEAYMKEHPIQGDTEDIIKLAIKNEASGAVPVVIADSAEMGVQDLEMQGWTEQDSTEGKNLLPVDVGQEVDGVVVTDSATFEEDGVHAVFESIGSGEARDIYMYGNSHTSVEDSYVEVPILTPGDYRLVNDNIGISLYVVAWRNGASVVLGYADNATTKITIQDGDKFRIFLRCNIIGDTDVKIHPMIVKEGEDTTQYEPYTGGKPSPNPDYPQEITSAGKYDEGTGKYEYEVKLTGANLFDIDDFNSNNKATIQNGTILFNQSLGTVTYNLNLGPGAYSISIARDGYSGINIKINEVEVINNGGGNNYTGNFDVSDGDSVVLEFSEGQNPNGEDRMIYDIMLNAGSTVLTYEPYHTPQTVTLTSDRPLTKWDRLVYMDGQWQWEYWGKNIVFNGSENWAITGEVNDNFAGFALRSDEYNAKRYSVMSVCDKFSYSLSSKPNTQRQVNGEYGLRFYIGYSELPNQTVVEFKKYLENNPVKFIYQLSDPEYTPLQQSEQTALNALTTYYPTTVLDNDQGCDMALTYIADTKAYIDNKVSAIQAAIVNAI